MSRLAIIGAGLAGLTAARTLVREGRAVEVFDKSRGTGGRLATRRTDLGAFDHGAPAAHGGDDFDAAMQDLESARRHGDGWQGRPGMSGLVKPLLEGVRLRGASRIVGLSGQRADWRLRDEGGDEHGPYAHVLLAIPAPQALLLAPHHDIEHVAMYPTWTLLAAWEGGALDLPGAGGPFHTIRTAEGRAVAHADPNWSADHLEDAREDTAAALLEALRGLGAPERAPGYLTAHRWRFARTARALGRDFLDYGDGRMAGGDWALGDCAGHAWRSGRAMARAVLSATSH